jgi:sarcosine oxidase subunit alpha
MAKDLRTLPPPAPRGRAVTIDFEGQPLRAHEGEPVAIALYAAGVRLLARSPKYHRPRGLFCASGHCGSCALRIDGRPNLRSCTTPAVEGLRCERQNAFPDPEVDLLRAADWLFPEGMDHHRLMTGTRLGNQLFVRLVRQMGGTGTLPDQAPAALPPPRDEVVDLCIVGAGPAGLAAARAAAAASPGRRVLVLDEQSAPGGALLALPRGWAHGAMLAEGARRAGAELLLGTTAIAYYPEDTRPGAPPGARPGVLAAVSEHGLLRVTARCFLYATGGYDQNLPFPDNDRPGVLAARAVGRLAFHWGVRPGRRVTFVTAEGVSPAYLAPIQAGLDAAGIPVTRADVAAPPRLDHRQDVLAVAALPAPASELPRQQGARVRLELSRGGFCVEVDDNFVCAPGVLATGDVTGYVGPEEAEAQGAAAGRAAAALVG